MTSVLRYALLFAVPSGTAMGSGIWLLTEDDGVALAAGLALGALVFAIVYVGGALGSANEELAEGPRRGS